MKTIQYNGPGHVLNVPGHFELPRGSSIVIPDGLADTLVRANPHLLLDVAKAPSKSHTRKTAETVPEPDKAPEAEAEPEADNGEGQPQNPEPKE